MTSEAALRLFAFLAIFTAMALWEWRSPRRRLSLSRAQRWPANLLILLFNTVMLRLIFPAALAGIALWARARDIGLFQQFDLHPWLPLLLSILLLDLAIYLQHVLFHHVPLLWRVHRVHHADLEIDVTTGGRFHPFEIFLSFGYKALWVLALGAPVLAVILFEVLLNTSSMFNHGNINLPTRVDRRLRSVLVTPDMHRIHHSTDSLETNRNFGFSLSVWDRIFGTYQASPQLGHKKMHIGLPYLRSPEELGFRQLLTQPFRRGLPAGHPAPDQPE